MTPDEVRRHVQSTAPHRFVEFRNSLTEFRNSLTEFRNSLTEFRNSLTGDVRLAARIERALIPATMNQMPDDAVAVGPEHVVCVERAPVGHSRMVAFPLDEFAAWADTVVLPAMAVFTNGVLVATNVLETQA
jgi:hypothetical protein